jgi:hypothetical protein
MAVLRLENSGVNKYLSVVVLKHKNYSWETNGFFLVLVMHTVMTIG